MSMTRKIKRTMAHKQLSEEGYRRVNTQRLAPYEMPGKIRGNKEESGSVFARNWKDAAYRRAELMKARRA